MTALRAADLHRTYGGTSPFARRQQVTAVGGVDLVLNPGDRVGLVGESGGGKSTLLRMLLGLDTPDSGTVTYRDRPVRPGRARSLHWFRSDVQAVPQDPWSSLNPRMRVGTAVAEPLRCLGATGPHDDRVAEVLRAVQLDPALADRYPDALSGGQRQRIAIARALAPAPRLLLADEPVSALDAAVRLRILHLLRDRAEQDGLGLLLVTHDLSAVREVCDRVLVMRAGEIVEQGSTADVFRAPQHEYTRTLIEAIPRLDAV
ncbi:ABC transporter ATP-binding protein [Saccharopolyspora sp. HNM0983]|uniref:ABC transporter ATP-binding protein n=1 Tax=Saccharopolyspora montiporae TaxID=2781240 RepID=A0A929B5U8_9PSEU|nr:ABC transporter ATP-binding protein [Saccharopolyspora sp. HNM0983]MBE9373714.1 ABC transporter ATP-binding protein [Saccharopolyspora sp. HNM0983]